ncbi:hypothetical protein LY76DRAFT_264450 [Colletotrichum caudatum]|nr:hypothetical protein LY76DRAFT_264450 [Colletotrichum caudatum]
MHTATFLSKVFKKEKTSSSSSMFCITTGLWSRVTLREAVFCYIHAYIHTHTHYVSIPLRRSPCRVGNNVYLPVCLSRFGTPSSPPTHPPSLFAHHFVTEEGRSGGEGEGYYRKRRERELRKKQENVSRSFQPCVNASPSVDPSLPSPSPSSQERNKHAAVVPGHATSLAFPFRKRPSPPPGALSLPLSISPTELSHCRISKKASRHSVCGANKGWGGQTEIPKGPSRTADMPPPPSNGRRPLARARERERERERRRSGATASFPVPQLFTRTKSGSRDLVPDSISHSFRILSLSLSFFLRPPSPVPASFGTSHRGMGGKTWKYRQTASNEQRPLFICLFCLVRPIVRFEQQLVFAAPPVLDLQVSHRESSLDSSPQSDVCTHALDSCKKNQKTTTPKSPFLPGRCRTSIALHQRKARRKKQKCVRACMRRRL